MLHAHVVPPTGGDTLFADLRAAYDELDDDTKVLIAGLFAEHSFNSRASSAPTDYTDASAGTAEVRLRCAADPGSGARPSTWLARVAHIRLADARRALLLRE